MEYVTRLHASNVVRQRQSHHLMQSSQLAAADSSIQHAPCHELLIGRQKDGRIPTGQAARLGDAATMPCMAPTETPNTTASASYTSSLPSLLLTVSLQQQGFWLLLLPYLDVACCCHCTGHVVTVPMLSMFAANIGVVTFCCGA